MYLETQVEAKANLVPTFFAIALIVPAILFWAWTEVRGSTPVAFVDALETRTLAKSVSAKCREQSKTSKYYFDCFDQIGLFENAASEALISKKPLMIIFGREQCSDCEKLEELFVKGPASSNVATSTAYREVASEVLQIRLVRYKQGTKEIARDLGAELLAKQERGRLYAPYIMFYDPSNGNTSHLRWADHEGLNIDRLGVALRQRLKSLSEL